VQGEDMLGHDFFHSIVICFSRPPETPNSGGSPDRVGVPVEWILANLAVPLPEPPLRVYPEKG
jgi:hypothetical protein